MFDHYALGTRRMSRQGAIDSSESAKEIGGSSSCVLHVVVDQKQHDRQRVSRLAVKLSSCGSVPEPNARAYRGAVAPNATLAGNVDVTARRQLRLRRARSSSRARAQWQSIW